MALWNCVWVCVSFFFCLTTHSVAPAAAESVQQSLRLLNLPRREEATRQRLVHRQWRARACARGTCTASTEMIPKLALQIFAAPNAVRRLRSRRRGLATRGEAMPSGRANCDAATATTWECQRAICSASHNACTSTPFQYFFFFWTPSVCLTCVRASAPRKTLWHTPSRPELPTGIAEGMTFCQENINTPNARSSASLIRFLRKRSRGTRREENNYRKETFFLIFHFEVKLEMFENKVKISWQK